MRISPALCGLAMVVLLAVAPASRVQAQPVDPAVVGERIQRLTAAVESLELALASQKRQIESLGNELHKLREDMVRQSADHLRQASARPWADDLKRLADAISEVDRKRAADGEQVVRVLNDLKKTLAASPEGPRSGRGSRSPRTGASRGGSSEDGGDKGSDKASDKTPDRVLEYVLERGQSLSEVISTFNEEAKRQGYQPLSVSQVMKFNNIKDDRRIPEGAKIQLPVIPAR